MKFARKNVKLDDYKDICEAFAKFLKNSDVILLKGDIGSGKTTFVASLAIVLGIKEQVISPTFAIAADYEAHGTQIENLIHIDTYRLTHVNELYDLGLETLFRENALTVIEWGERIEDFIEANHFRLSFFDENPESRDLVFEFEDEHFLDRIDDIETALSSNKWSKQR